MIWCRALSGFTREVERDEESAYTESDLEDSLSY